jgi:hypothetical protein
MWLSLFYFEFLIITIIPRSDGFFLCGFRIEVMNLVPVKTMRLVQVGERCVKIITNSVKHRPSEADNHPIRREVPRFLWNAKIHYLVHKSPPIPWPCVTFVTKCFFFYFEELLGPRPTSKLEDHSLSAVRNCLFSMFAATLHIWSPSPSSATRGDGDPHSAHSLLSCYTFSWIEPPLSHPQRRYMNVDVTGEDRPHCSLCMKVLATGSVRLKK